MIISNEIFERVLSIDKFIIDSAPIGHLKNRLSQWFNEIIFSDFSLPSVKDGDVVFFRSLVRDDYYESFHAVIRASGIRNPVIIDDYITASNPQRMNRATSRFMLDNQDLFDHINETDGLKRAILFIRLCKYAFIKHHFKNTKPRLVVFHADMQPVEYLLACHFRSLGVTTVTLQHGLYVDYSGYDTINKINYLHQPSEYFLSWGPSTSELIRRHHPDTKIIECGKPLISSANPPDLAPETSPYIALLLDQKPFHRQNEEMIEIVQAYALRSGLDIRVRFHPSLPKAAILTKYPFLTEQLHFTDAQMVVGHTSTMIYEALALGCHVMRFASDIPAIKLPKNSEFRTLEELEAHAVFPVPSDLSQYYFTAFGDEALENYKSFFASLLSTPSERLAHG
ncbi:hypothetical protein [Sulfitobacter sp. CS16]|jgi:hypothetical protein|uniref:hypothetical protein n=1 Tax=Sulfitobacter sp. CS16 TaxID=3368573 RepID=UPI00374550C4